MELQTFTPGARLSHLAAENPDEIALIVEQLDGTSSTLIRRELDRWSNRLAHRLARDGVGPRSFVVINIATSLEHVVAELAPGFGPAALAEPDRHARRLLAAYMVPRSYEATPELPRDETGKIRRSRLREERGG